MNVNFEQIVQIHSQTATTSVKTKNIRKVHVDNMYCYCNNKRPTLKSTKKIRIQCFPYLVRKRPSLRTWKLSRR